MPALKSCLLLLTLFAFVSCTNIEEKGNISSTEQTIAVMTYNIKYDDKSDTPTGWGQRKDRVTNLIAFYQPDFLGTQEGLLHQLEYLETNLDSMQWIGVGRTDGKTEGEFSALFYNTRRFELVEGSDSTIWLSETPGQPGKSWDAALPRILTWGKFQDKITEDKFFVFNTHFDHVGDIAKVKSAQLILRTIKKVTGKHPYILTGDFNVETNSKPYAILTDATSGLRDAHHKSALPPIGPEFTFEGFNVLSSVNKRRIDYIFVSNEFEVLKYGIISDFRNGRYPSDHLPVIADIKI